MKSNKDDYIHGSVEPYDVWRDNQLTKKHGLRNIPKLDRVNSRGSRVNSSGKTNHKEVKVEISKVISVLESYSNMWHLEWQSIRFKDLIKYMKTNLNKEN